MNEFVKLSLKDFGLNTLDYVSFPGYSFDCWLVSSGVTLDILQDQQMLDDFVEAKRGRICVITGDRYINKRSTLYIDGNNLHGYAMMQNLTYKDFEYYSTSIDEMLNTPDDSDLGLIYSL